MPKVIPLGIRNRNPGNIRYVVGVTSTYVGCTGASLGFCVFDTAQHGIRAMGKLLLVYQDKHKLNTIRGIIHRWAPTNENNTTSYIDDVSKRSGFGPDDPLDLHNYSVLVKLIKAMIWHENGQMPYKDTEFEVLKEK